MKPATALALAAVGGVIALRYLPREARERLTSVAERQMLKGMEHMMASLPEGSPPKPWITCSCVARLTVEDSDAGAPEEVRSVRATSR